MEFVMQFVYATYVFWDEMFCFNDRMKSQKSFWTKCISPDEVKILHTKLSGWIDMRNGQIFCESWIHIDIKTSEIVYHFLFGAQIRVGCNSYKYDWFESALIFIGLSSTNLSHFERKMINALIECARRCFKMGHTYIFSWGIFITIGIHIWCDNNM